MLKIPFLGSTTKKGYPAETAGRNNYEKSQQRHLRHYKEIQKIPREFKSFQKFPKDSKGFKGIQKSAKDSKEGNYCCKAPNII